MKNCLLKKILEGRTNELWELLGNPSQSILCENLKRNISREEIEEFFRDIAGKVQSLKSKDDCSFCKKEKISWFVLQSESKKIISSCDNCIKNLTQYQEKIFPITLSMVNGFKNEEEKKIVLNFIKDSLKIKDEKLEEYCCSYWKNKPLK